MHPTSVQHNLLRFTPVARDVVRRGHVIAHHIDECTTDAGTLFVDGVLGGIGHILHTLAHGGGGAIVHQLLVDFHQFFPVVGQVAEVYPFRMTEEQQVEGSVQRGKLDGFCIKKKYLP